MPKGRKVLRLKRRYVRYLAILIICTIMLGLFLRLYNNREIIIIRKPAVAGQWYPDSEDELRILVEGYFESAKDVELPSKVRAMVSPHAGYVYSGQVAANVFNLISKEIDTVIIIGASHHARYNGASIDNVTHYLTPMGKVKLSDKVKQLRKEEGFVSLHDVHVQEHSIEVMLPFLQATLGEFDLIPILAGNIDPNDLAEVITKYIDDRTLLIISTDLSHYYTYDKAVELDKNCIEAIPNLDFELIDKCECCGKIPVLTLMLIAKEKGWQGQLIDYKNSGDTAGNRDRVVGYGAFAFYKLGIGAEEKEILLSLARSTVDEYLKTGKIPEIDESKIPDHLKNVQGCFVTLNKNKQLRGCIGHIFPVEPLYKCVFHNAINAAVNDKRFSPVIYDELENIEVEISVLTVPEELEYRDSDELLEKLRPMVDGVVIDYQGRRSTYLPQVWEQLPEKEQFLSNLCHKQGSPINCWKSNNAVISTYQALVFHE